MSAAVDILGALNPDALRLARYASLAARVEPELLRALRVTLMEDADVSAEADLWWSTLVETRSPTAIRLADDALPHLRQALVGSGEAKRANEVIAEIHATAPDVTRLEEALTYHALVGELQRVDKKLREILGTLLRDPVRRSEVGAWAIAALPRLPAAAQDLPSFWSVHFVASAQGRGVARVSPQGKAAAADGARQVGSFLVSGAKLVELEAIRRGDKLLLRQTDRTADATEAVAGLLVPKLDPLVVEVESETATVVEIAKQDWTEVPVAGADITLRAIDGRTYELRPRAREAVGGPVPPAHLVLAADVFRTTSMPIHTLVKTPQLDELCFEVTVPGRLLVVEGPSGIGKTMAVKYALDWVTRHGHQRWNATYLNARDPSDVARIDALLRRPTAELSGYTIIDDFHHLEPERKRHLGHHAKALADRDGQEAKLIFVGTAGVHESIVRDVPDLGSRVTTMRIRRVDVAHISELIEKGQQALNVEFVHRARLAVAAQGSFIIAQRLCETAVRKARIWQTMSPRVRLDFDVPELLPAVLDSLKAELYPRVLAFAMQDARAEARGAALALLWHLLEADDGSIQISYVGSRYPELHDGFEMLQRKIAESSDDTVWRSLFYYDPAGGLIAIEDPKLHFYLKHLRWEQFARDCGVEMRVRPDNGQLGFLPPRQRTSTVITRELRPTQSRTAQPTPAAGPTVRVLHLSDFHFRASTTWDASTVLGRLSVDIGRLVYEGLAPDLIVLTGDIAYSGKAAEYDLARTWITKELLPAAGVGVDRLVIVPGNHDADRSRVDFVARQIAKGIRDERNQQRVTEVLDGTGGSLLLGRLEAFMGFVNDLGAAGAPLQRPWYQAIFELEGMTLHCAAMASPWLSADDNDYGGLLLGLRQCNEVLAGADQADVVLVALHHPWDYVAEWDRRSSLAEIERSAGLILRGHLHEERHDYRASVRHGGVLELAAGACYESSEHPSSYHLVELWPRAPQERRARVHVRYWDPARRDWRPDLNAFGAPWGELPLRVRHVGKTPTHLSTVTNTASAFQEPTHTRPSTSQEKLRKEGVDVLIVTAVKDEWEAVLAVDTGAEVGSTWENLQSSNRVDMRVRNFHVADGVLRIAVMQVLGIGRVETIGAAAQLLNEHQIRCLAMCGICAGRRGEVELGDVIIADRIWTYDNGKQDEEHVKQDVEILYQIHPPEWKYRAERFVLREAPWLAQRPRSYDVQGDWVMAQIHTGGDPRSDPERGAKCADFEIVVRNLWDRGWLKKGTLTLTVKGKRRIEEKLLLHHGTLPEPTSFAVHCAPIASVSRMIEGPNIFDRLSTPVRKVLGLEMEASAIATLAYQQQLEGAVVMKGVVDYADGDKSDNFRPFAARASAECLIAFLRENLPPRIGTEPAPSLHAKDLAKASERSLVEHVLTLLSSFAISPGRALTEVELTGRIRGHLAHLDPSIDVSHGVSLSERYRADLLVERHGQKVLIEIKRGRPHGRILSAATEQMGLYLAAAGLSSGIIYFSGAADASARRVEEQTLDDGRKLWLLLPNENGQ